MPSHPRHQICPKSRLQDCRRLHHRSSFHHFRTKRRCAADTSTLKLLSVSRARRTPSDAVRPLAVPLLHRVAAIADYSHVFCIRSTVAVISYRSACARARESVPPARLPSAGRNIRSRSRPEPRPVTPASRADTNFCHPAARLCSVFAERLMHGYRKASSVVMSRNSVCVVALCRACSLRILAHVNPASMICGLAKIRSCLSACPVLIYPGQGTRPFTFKSDLGVQGVPYERPLCTHLRCPELLRAAQ